MHWSPEQAGAILLASGIDPQRRAETLSLGEWEALALVVTVETPPQPEQDTG
jgi:hypothetical protein